MNQPAAEYAITVPAGVSTVVLPPRSRGVQADAGWIASTAVTQGSILFNGSNNEHYMVLIAGTTGTEAPDGVYGKPESNGTATLIHCFRSPMGRVRANVTQQGDSDLWYQLGMTAGPGGGEFAYLKGQQYRTDENGAISVYAETEVILNIKDQ